MNHRHHAALAALAIAPMLAVAAGASGASYYPEWTITPSGSVGEDAQDHVGTVTFGVMAFPEGGTFTNVKTADDGQPVRLGSSDVIAQGTPWGSVFGSSAGSRYLSVRVTRSTGTVATATYEFSRPLPPGSWGFTLGDIDVDQAAVRARTGTGELLSGAEIAGSVGNASVPFNFLGTASLTLPQWLPTAVGGMLRGFNGQDGETEGDAGWFMPSRPVQQLTVTFQAQAGGGSPSYRTWFAVVAHPITGTVLREDTGKAVEGDVLTLTDPDGNVLDVTTSDANGNYAFPNVYAQPGYTVTMRPPPGLTTVGPSKLTVSTQTGPAVADFRLRPGASGGGTGGSSTAESSVGYSNGDAALVVTPGLQATRVGMARPIAIESTCSLTTRATIPAGLAVVSAKGATRRGRTVTWTGGTGAYRLVVRPTSGPSRIARVRVSTTCPDGSTATTASRLRIIARAAATRVTG